MSLPATAYQRVWEVVAAIPPGRTASYALVADLAGLPRRARFVALALRRAPAGLNLPWHRVLRADGRIGFAPGSEDWHRQVGRLAEEGVAVVNGRVDHRRCGWSLDERLWGLP